MLKRVRDFANAVRCLSIDMVNEANSGHQGMPLGFADVISVLFNRCMKFEPNDETRDRLILSAGHASAMLYSAIYLTQKTTLSLDDLKRFRKFKGICQGHPEINQDLGIEMTTGALGQGLATAVGIAIALKKKKLENKVFVIVGDGCLMEGVSHEAMTLASSLNLDNLIILFDNNNVCMDGKPSDYTTDNIARFKAYDFETFEANGHDYDDIFDKIESAKNATKPSFIAFKTTIGYPSRNSGSNKCHGKFVSNDEAKELRQSFGFSTEPFDIPTEILWEKQDSNSKANESRHVPEEKLKQVANNLKLEFANDDNKSTRSLAGRILERFCKEFKLIIGGSADLSESNCTLSKTHNAISKNSFDGNYIHYGIREHAMGCVMSGLAIEGFIPYGGTFLVFSDYMRPAIRNAALMKLAPIFVFTHDSIAVGEDGATHQPIEHITSLRLIPNLNIMRPACVFETIECIELAMRNRETPSALILSRQNLKKVRNSFCEINLSEKGMYEVEAFSNNGNEKLSIIATGSEVMLAKEIKDNLQDFDIRIISAPCLELFDQQPQSYKNEILSGRKLFLESGVGDIWNKYKTDSKDLIIGISEFGESGSAKDLFNKFGLNATSIIKLIRENHDN